MFPIRPRGALLVPALALLAAPLSAQTASCPDPTSLADGISGPLAHVRYLADDALEGREVGSAGAQCAAEYIAAQFRAMGLQPAGSRGSFYQTFPVRKGAAYGAGNELGISNKGYALGKDWVPLGFSASASLNAQMVYAGYGLSRPGNPDDATIVPTVRIECLAELGPLLDP